MMGLIFTSQADEIVLSNDPNYDFEGKTVAQVIADGAQHILYNV
ncbi:hypothetical protein [Sphingobacterium olei]|nr:hypothetical protein [Sphingobacterium olei]